MFFIQHTKIDKLYRIRQFFNRFISKSIVLIDKRSLPVQREYPNTNGPTGS